MKATPAHYALLLTAAALVVIGVLAVPFGVLVCGLTLAYAGSYHGLDLALVIASAVIAFISPGVCIGAAGHAIAMLLRSAPLLAVGRRIMVAVAALPIAFACWYAVAHWVAR